MQARPDFTFEWENIKSGDGFKIACHLMDYSPWEGKNIRRKDPCCNFFITNFQNDTNVIKGEGVYAFVGWDKIKNEWIWYCGRSESLKDRLSSHSRTFNPIKSIFYIVPNNHFSNQEIKILENYVREKLKKEKITKNRIASKNLNQPKYQADLDNKNYRIIEAAVNRIWTIVFNFMAFEFYKLQSMDNFSSAPKNKKNICSTKNIVRILAKVFTKLERQQTSDSVEQTENNNHRSFSPDSNQTNKNSLDIEVIFLKDYHYPKANVIGSFFKYRPSVNFYSLIESIFLINEHNESTQKIFDSNTAGYILSRDKFKSLIYKYNSESIYNDPLKRVKLIFFSEGSHEFATILDVSDINKASKPITILQRSSFVVCRKNRSVKKNQFNIWQEVRDLYKKLEQEGYIKIIS